MSGIIKAFTAKAPDTCCKCGVGIEIGQEISWLRDAERKGNFHAVCSLKPTIPALTMVKVQDGSPVGYQWMRVNAIPKTMAQVKPTQPNKLFTPETRAVLEAPLPGPWEMRPVVPEVGTGVDGIVLNAIAKALLPALGKLVAEQKGPRIVVNVYVAKAGEEEKALDLLSKELFLLQSVKEL